VCSRPAVQVAEGDQRERRWHQDEARDPWPGVPPREHREAPDGGPARRHRHRAGDARVRRRERQRDQHEPGRREEQHAGEPAHQEPAAALRGRGGFGSGPETASGRVVGRSIASELEPSTHAGCSQHPAVRIELLMREHAAAGEGVPRSGARAERRGSPGPRGAAAGREPPAGPCRWDRPHRLRILRSAFGGAQPRDDEETFTRRRRVGSDRARELKYRETRQPDLEFACADDGRGSTS
jgi:hypothetical protein